ncbi:Ocrl [Scenedesmus sp. PABB004]|nr:Ocrl [Scenedesmus sp. PABB004]
MKSLLNRAAGLVGKQLEPAPPAGGAGGAAAPGRPDPVLEHLLRDFRSAKLHAQFFARPAGEYTETHDVRVLAGTYNVAGKRPPPGLRLHEWLDQWRACWPGAAPRGGGACGPDIVVVGFQEVVPLSAGNVIAGPSAAGADAWDHTLAATLNGDDWAARNFGRTFGSAPAAEAGSQASYAYNMISSQAASVVGAMDKVWAGGGAGGGEDAAQQARLALALESAEDGDDVYVQVACKQLVGVYVSLWARKATARCIRGVEAAAAATGFGGYLGNKGAAALRLRVHDASLVVVAAHLASGDAEGDEARRNADAAEILRRCTFGGGGGAAPAPGGHWGGLAAIAEHTNVIWLGDLNYRLTCSADEAGRLLRAGRLEALLRYDQLSREMEAGRVFAGWREGPISFPPTYKYHLGCNVYSGDALPPGLAAGLRAVDSGASLADSDGAAGGAEAEAGGAGRDSPAVEKQKRRTPAWCDRVLWLAGGALHQLAYGRGELVVSDHRPVAAAFLLQAHRYDRDAVRQLAESCRRALDVSDNASRPRCTLSPNFVELHAVPFGEPRRAAVTLANVGPAPARFYFVAPPMPRLSSGGVMQWDDSQPLAPPWLQVEPTEGEVAPGESATITLTALITGGGPSSAAAQLAAAPAPPGGPAGGLDTILILRLEDGTDSFISCRGTALPSCFGMDLDALLALGAAPVLPRDALGDGGDALLAAGLAPRGGAAGGGAAQLSAGVEGLALGDGDAAAGGAAELRTGLEGRVPKEVQRLVSFLHAHLHTPGLFVHSARICCSGSSAGAAEQEQQLLPGELQPQPDQLALLAATAPVRWALDAGVPLPAHVTPHQAAAALLLMTQQLPEPLLPPAVSAALAHCVPHPQACSSLLSDGMSVAEWATLRHCLALLRAALAPRAAAASGVTLQGLARVLAGAWFGGAAPPEVEANRLAFAMTLLDPEGAAAGQQQQQQQQQQQAGAPPPASSSGGRRRRRCSGWLAPLLLAALALALAPGARGGHVQVNRGMREHIKRWAGGMPLGVDYLGELSDAQRVAWSHDLGYTINDTLAVRPRRPRRRTRCCDARAAWGRRVAAPPLTGPPPCGRQALTELAVPITVDVKLVGFAGDGNMALHLADHELQAFLKSLHNQLETVALHPAPSYMAVKPEVQFRVQPAYYELAPRVAGAINQAINAGTTSSAYAPYPLHLVPAAAVDAVIADDYAHGDGALTIYLLNPPAHAPYAYSYVDDPAGPAGNASCPGSLWVGAKRYAWFDLTANLTFYGPGPGGRGQVFAHSTPLLQHYKKDTLHRAILPDLAALVWSGCQARAARRSAGRPPARAALARPRRRAADVRATVSAAPQHLVWPPLHHGVLSHSKALEVHLVYMRELTAVAEPLGQAVSVAEHFVLLADCDHCVTAFAGALKARTSRVPGGKGLTMATSHYLDLAELEVWLREWRDALLSEAGVNWDTEHGGAAILPVFIFDLPTREPVLLDGLLQAAGLGAGDVVAVRTSGEPVPTFFGCFSAQMRLDPRAIHRPVLAAVLQQAYGVADGALSWSAATGKAWSFLWSVGGTPFGALSSGRALSFVQRDAAGRNLALAYLNSSMAHAATLIGGFEVLRPDGHLRHVKSFLQPEQVLPYNQRIALLLFKIKEAAAALGAGQHGLALGLAASTVEDVAALHKITKHFKATLSPDLVCMGRDEHARWWGLPAVCAFVTLALVVWRCARGGGDDDGGVKSAGSRRTSLLGGHQHHRAY